MRRRKLSVTRLSAMRDVHRKYNGGQRLYYFDDLSDARGFGGSRKGELVRSLKTSSFDPNWDYKPWQLELWGDVWLREDSNVEDSWPDQPYLPGYPPLGWRILTEQIYTSRLKREVYVASGTPDETVTKDLSPDGQTFYWRSHPRGRRVNSHEARTKRGASYYR